MLCSSRKYPFTEIPRERGFKSTIFEGKYDAKLEFPEGWGGAQTKNLLWGYGNFLEQHIISIDDHLHLHHFIVTIISGTGILEKVREKEVGVE